MIEIKPLESRITSWREVSYEIENLFFERQLANLNFKRFVVKDGDAIIGAGQYAFVTERCVLINAVHVAENERRIALGEGLLRAMLNSAEMSGATSAVFIGNEIERAFYRHVLNGQCEDFDKDSSAISEVIQLELNRVDLGDSLVLPSIAAFFDQPCKGIKKK
ncbi:MAG: hypothetical protein BGO41_01850 [Clostridiales bacterium 38-18]|nr:MAG: hypothetical protein BGO41_01850 [Clostridiales bacterium 38-18]